MTFQTDTLKPTVVNNRPGTKRRWGKPRVKWVESTLQDLWILLGKTIKPDLRGAIMNLEKKHVVAIKEAARQNIHNESTTSANKRPTRARQGGGDHSRRLNPFGQISTT